MMAGNLVVSTINGNAIGVKNAIINGNFGINQRGVSGTVTLAAGVYGHDRWKAGASGCTYTFATVDNVTTLTISAGSLIQVIEGINLQSGTYTLSFTGTAQGKIGAGSFGASGITGAAVGGTNLNVEFNTGTVSLVQLERGTVATPFEVRSIGQELGLCQRYCIVYGGKSPYERFGIGLNASTTAAYPLITFPVEMRALPTVSFSSLSHFVFWNGNILGSPTNITIEGAGGGGSTKYGTIGCNGSGLTAQAVIGLIGNNNINARMTFNSEL